MHQVNTFKGESSISVSAFAAGFHRHCPDYTVDETDTARGILNRGAKKVSEAAAAGGMAWENLVYERIEEGSYSFYEEARGADETDKVTIEDASLWDKQGISILDRIRGFLDGDTKILYLKQVRLCGGERFASEDKRESFLGAYLAASGKTLRPGNADLICLTKEEFTLSDGTVTDGVCIAICDIKAAAGVKLYHKIQVEIYCEFLESLLEEEEELAKRCRVPESGYVWTRPSAHPERFMRLFVRNFLKERLTEPSLGIGSHEAGIMNASGCEGCIRIDQCLKENIDRGRELLLLPNLSENDAAFLIREGLTSVSSLQACMAKKDRDKTDRLKACGYFKRLLYYPGNLEKYLTLFKENIKNKANGGYVCKDNTRAPGFPLRNRDTEDVQIILTAQYEQVSNSYPILAMLIGTKGKSAKVKLSAIFETCGLDADGFGYYAAKSTARRELDRNFARFCAALAAVLKTVHDENLTLQGYVTDPAERYHMERVFWDGLAEMPEDGVRKDLAVILTWIRSAKTPGYAPCILPDQEMHPALLAVSEIIQTCFLLPVPVAYDTESMAACFALQDAEAKSYTKERDIFCRFSDAVKTDFLYEWYGKEEAQRRRVLTDRGSRLCVALKARMRTLASVIGHLRGILADEKRFTGDCAHKLPALPDPDRKARETERIACMLQYETWLAKRDTRKPRLAGLQEGVSSRGIMKLSCVALWDQGYDCDPWREKGCEKEQTVVRAGGRYYLDDVDNVHRRMILADGRKVEKVTLLPEKKYIFRAEGPVRKLFDYPAIVCHRDFYTHVPVWDEIGEGDANEYIRKIRGRFRWVYQRDKNGEESRTGYVVVDDVFCAGHAPEAGALRSTKQICYLIRYFDDTNERKLLDFLHGYSSISGEVGDRNSRRPVPGILNVPADPAFYARGPLVPVDLREDLFADDPDKQQAFCNLVHYRISQIIGAPGTGKTYFIGRSLAHILAGASHKPLRVLVSANSWAAIHNMLDAIRSAVRDYTGEAGRQIPAEDRDRILERIIALPVYSDRSANRLIDESLEDEKLGSGTPLVIGTTCWQLYNLCDGRRADEKRKGLNFDLIILDEATQVRFADALISLFKVKENGRILIVGDEDQLGAIVQGDYEVPENADNFFGSVFRLFYERFMPFPEAKRPLTQLNQCRRMNEALTRYLADTIYGEAYTSVAEKRTGRIRLARSFGVETGNTDMLAEILDPDYQLTLCIVACEGNEAGVIEKTETELVRDLVLKLHREIRDKEDRPVSFAGFWGGGQENEMDGGSHRTGGKAEDGFEKETEAGAEDESALARECAIALHHPGVIGVISPYNRLNDDLTDQIVDGYAQAAESEKSALGIDGWSADRIREYIRCATVDKFQGQEREVIVTCYGERDLDSLLAIRDFVYSRNRLNVVLSRAKKKCIVLLSDTVARRHPECYEDADERVSRGVEFLCGLKDYLTGDEKAEETECFVRRAFSFRRKAAGSSAEVKVTVYQKGCQLPDAILCLHSADDCDNISSVSAQ